MPEIPEDGALLKMEVAGICGTDVKLYKTPPSSAPVIMGHENIGVIASGFLRQSVFNRSAYWPAWQHSHLPHMT